MATQLSDQELDDIYAFAVQLGKDAGKMLMDRAQLRMRSTVNEGEQKFQEKENSVDIVTQTDTGKYYVEAFIHTSISKRYPHHKFIGEETYSAGASRDYLITPDHPTWCVDPLDGTVNYTHLFPMFCVSIALLEHGTPIIGVIHAPFTAQLFSARRGHGAWLNETQRLPLLHTPIPAAAPRGCLFSCEWGKDRRVGKEGNLGRKIDSFVKMAVEAQAGGGMVHGVRSLGSATLDLAYVAMGAFDVWWEGGCWEWDVAAGVAILMEAGGLVTSANPPQDPERDPIEAVRLGSRLYLAIRPAAPTETETARQGQERLVREVWKRVQALDYSRPGA